jgi:protein tyrosine phosphatase (PTP) superfamily phosphohydrolase (DUF442 family)
MLGSIASWTQKLRESTQAQPHTTSQAFAALDSIEKAVASMADGETVRWKKEIRDRLWEFRQAFPQDADPEIRRTYEKLRNLTLDNTIERIARGGKIPSSHFTTLPPASDLPNFQIVSDTYLRGGQPDQDGLSWLAQAGVKSRIDLRGDDRDNQWYPPVWNPIKTFTVDVPDFASPTIEMVEKFLSIADNPANQPVFVHCKAGIGRTGVMTACRNIAHGMTADEALRQESINSYHGNLSQEAFVREFETYWLAKQAAAKAAPAPASAA